MRFILPKPDVIHKSPWLKSWEAYCLSEGLALGVTTAPRVPKPVRVVVKTVSAQCQNAECFYAVEKGAMICWRCRRAANADKTRERRRERRRLKRVA